VETVSQQAAAQSRLISVLTSPVGRKPVLPVRMPPQRPPSRLAGYCNPCC